MSNARTKHTVTVTDTVAGAEDGLESRMTVQELNDALKASAMPKTGHAPKDVTEVVQGPKSIALSVESF